MYIRSLRPKKSISGLKNTDTLAPITLTFMTPGTVLGTTPGIIPGTIHGIHIAATIGTVIDESGM
jgi:hypothetical protein